MITIRLYYRCVARAFGIADEAHRPILGEIKGTAILVLLHPLKQSQTIFVTLRKWLKYGIIKAMLNGLQKVFRVANPVASRLTPSVLLVMNPCAHKSQRGETRFES